MMFYLDISSSRVLNLAILTMSTFKCGVIAKQRSLLLTLAPAVKVQASNLLG
jgi:hypothetical protein